MKDTLVSAKLISWRLIRVTVFSSLPRIQLKASLYQDQTKRIPLKEGRLNSLTSLFVADYSLEQDLVLGHAYEIRLEGYGAVPLDVNDASLFPDFDERFAYDGEDLGASYLKSVTRFALWAPLSSSCALKWKDKEEDPWQLTPMVRSPKGVYRASLKGDHALARYLYVICNSGVVNEVTDIYAKGSTANGASSVVINPSKFKMDLDKSSLPVLNSATEAIIYEGNVRDLTIDSHSNIVRKGTFLGLCEKGRKTEGGHPAGFDYITSLGITHLQLMPIYDFQTVDELNPKKGYNWGYDPAQYFVPEGSYASVLDDPSSRIRDLKTMVKAYHQAGIRIVMDVVFNHVYAFEGSVFQRTVPNYYFRQIHDGRFASTSGCGDDLASERAMVRKLIVDACAYWIDEYGIDGFRFDLMGIIDCQTLSKIARMAKGKDPSFLLYGEGWNMGGEVALPLGHMGNYAQLPSFGFFNDYFRETIKKLFAGERWVINDAKYCYASSSVDFFHTPRFLNANQSINYVECHDNATYFDHLSKVRKDWDEGKKLQAIAGVNAFVALSFGVSFFHAGQEIGMSKWGEDNTYNKGDRFNQFSYSLLDERYDMAERFKEIISLRKRLKILHAYDPTYIDWNVDIGEIGPCIKITFLDPSSEENKKKATVYFNCSEIDYNIDIGDAKSILTSALIKQDDLRSECFVPALSLLYLES